MFTTFSPASWAPTCEAAGSVGGSVARDSLHSRVSGTPHCRGPGRSELARDGLRSGPGFAAAAARQIASKLAPTCEAADIVGGSVARDSLKPGVSDTPHCRSPGRSELARDGLRSGPGFAAAAARQIASKLAPTCEAAGIVGGSAARDGLKPGVSDTPRHRSSRSALPPTGGDAGLEDNPATTPRSYKCGERDVDTGRGQACLRHSRQQAGSYVRSCGHCGRERSSRQPSLRGIRHTALPRSR